VEAVDELEEVESDSHAGWHPGSGRDLRADRRGDVLELLNYLPQRRVVG
jgi:hypothetical protein